MQIIDKKPPYLLHILGSLLFISIPVFSLPEVNTTEQLFDIIPFQRNFLNYILLLAFFYANYLYLLPRLYFTKKKLLYFACIVLCYIMVIFLPLLNFISVMLMHSVIFFLIFSMGFLLKVNERMTNIQSENLKTQISYLRALIDPHFLFNTLNGVYALVLEKSDSAPEAILSLSSMMRYVVTESNQKSVSLEKEIDYIKNYISLQQLRMDSQTSFSFNVTGDPTGKSISPLLLIPFVENTFKYGLNPERESSIAINIEINANELKLNIENNKVNFPLHKHEKNEQGLENTVQRLEYLYPDKHKLLIFDKEHTFTVNLSITLL